MTEVFLARNVTHGTIALSTFFAAATRTSWVRREAGPTTYSAITPPTQSICSLTKRARQ